MLSKVLPEITFSIWNLKYTLFLFKSDMNIELYAIIAMYMQYFYMSYVIKSVHYF